MQVLSMWPSKGGLSMVPQLDFELGSHYFPSIRREKRWGLVDIAFHGKTSGLLMVSSNSRYDRNGTCVNSSGFLSNCSKLKFALFCEPKKGSSGSSVAMASALEQQQIGNKFHGGESSLDDGFPGKSEMVNIDSHNLNRLENSDDDNCNLEENSHLDFGSEEEVREEKDTRIDVRALALSLHSAESADDVEEVLKDKGELPLQVYSSMIKGFGWDKKMASAFALVEWLKRKKETGSIIGPNLFIYNSLLSALKQSEQHEETEKILNDMAQEGIFPNVVTYNTLMGIYVEQGQPTKALDILEEIHKNGFTPSAASYSTALLAYRKMEDGNGALAFYVDIKEKYKKGEIGKDSDENWEKEFVKLENFIIRICYQVMRRWLVRHDNFSINVLKLLTDMDKAGLKPGRADYERLLWACTREEHYIVAKELYSRIRERYSEISLSVCNHVIWLMGKAKKWWAALEIYEDLLDKGPRPNNLSHELIVSHFNVLLTAARKRGIWRWGVRLLNKMEDKGLKPGSREWNAVLVACSKASETSAAIQIFSRMIEQGEKPTIISYGALLSALEKGKLYNEAVRVWEHMLKVGVKPNVYAYTIMASVYAGQGKFGHVDAIIHEMTSSSIEPTIITYNAIISGCVQNSMSGAAYEWFHRMKVQNISPNKITYEMLIEALAKDGKPRIAYELYLRAQNEGLDLSAKVYDAVVHSSHIFGATVDINVLGPRPPDKKKKVQIRKTLTEFCNLADVPRRSKPFDRTEIYPAHLQKENND
ncbi:hypothetical protein JCGZ_10203 [Jatropha curcas]|uniref:Uncharacterized protein n=1 Tax=Jatropha curcas TaxID=180498 RepID=A0A067LGA6_JATCU|nr:protein LOW PHOTOSYNTHETIC EFFICIENCY 1, chloroplastic [Jatropha curcas]KDP46363.1 hypothetical protein JCGZ_10203 [Jatropha curcas]